MSLAKLLKCLKQATKVVYSFNAPIEGSFWEMWTGDASAPHGPISSVFSGPADLWGTPAHVNGAPNHSGVQNDMTWNDVVLIGRELAAEGNQQARMWGYKRVPADGFIRDNNGNTGETGRMYCGIPDGCCNNQLTVIAEQVTNTTAAQRGILGATPVPVKEGDYIPYVVLISDLSAFFGFDLEFSADGETGWENMTSHLGKGEWTKRRIPFCVPMEDDETDCPPEPCDTGPYVPDIVPDGWVCEEVCAAVGYVTVSATGDVVQSCGGAVVNKTGTGSYNITAPAGAATSNAWAIIGEPGDNNNNDVRAHFSSSFTTGDFHIEQQSGNGQWQDVDKPFTIQWYGMRQQVVC